MTELPLDPIAIDVGSLVKRTVTSLYSHLVTRPTGRAVRMAIENQLAGVGERSLSMIDLSEVTVLDYSCADEVVAKLLQRYLEADAHEAFFVFCGVHEPHRDQIQVVLERQNLAAVAETGKGSFELLGVPGDHEREAWNRLDEQGMVGSDEVLSMYPEQCERDALDRIVERRLAFRSPISGRYHALSRLVQHLL